MFDSLLLLNQLGSVDIGFFVACAVIVVLCVAIYFLIPVFNKKQYQEQRDNLKKREEAFHSNKSVNMAKDENVPDTLGGASDDAPVADSDNKECANDMECDSSSNEEDDCKCAKNCGEEKSLSDEQSKQDGGVDNK